MKYAIIGCGRISPNHFAAAKANELDIIAVCDLLPEKMQEKLNQFELADVPQYTDYKELLAKEKPELVAICTESGCHGEIALAALEAGAHCIIEKPIALSIAEANAIVEKAEKKGLLVSACHQNRFNKSVQKIREALEEGRFGKLMHGAAHIRWNRGSQYYEQAKWRGTWAHDGGCLMNQCIHNIDLLLWMFGEEPVEVMAYTDNLIHPEIEAEDLGLAIVKFANGAYGLIEGTTNVYPKNLEETLYIFGEKGTVKAGGHSVNLIEEWNFADGKDDPEEIKRQYHENPPNIYGFGHTPLYANVLDAIRNHKQPAVTAEAGKKAMEMVLAIYKSAAEGKPVKLPLENVASTDFTGRFR